MPPPQPIRLKLAGIFESKYLQDEVMQYKGWEQVDVLGLVNRKDVAEVFGQSLAGLVIFSPLPNHIDAQPNKLFEYMSAGLPVIASNFPLWKDIVENNKCGICVDPNKPEEIALAIDFIVNNKEQAFEMGKNGRKAVQEMYNWQIEEEKLVKAYDALLASDKMICTS